MTSIVEANMSKCEAQEATEEKSNHVMVWDGSAPNDCVNKVTMHYEQE